MLIFFCCCRRRAYNMQQQTVLWFVFFFAVVEIAISTITTKKENKCFLINNSTHCYQLVEKYSAACSIYYIFNSFWRHFFLSLSLSECWGMWLLGGNSLMTLRPYFPQVRYKNSTAIWIQYVLHYFQWEEGQINRIPAGKQIAHTRTNSSLHSL